LTSLRNNTPFDALEKGCFSFGEWLTRCRPVAVRKNNTDVLKNNTDVLKNNTDVFSGETFKGLLRFSE